MFIEGGRIYPTAPLKQLCSKIGSGATPKGGKTAYQESGVSLVRSTNVFDYAFSYDDLAHISDEQADQLSNVIVEENDVLFNITGVSVTRCCIGCSSCSCKSARHDIASQNGYANELLHHDNALLCRKQRQTHGNRPVWFDQRGN